SLCTVSIVPYSISPARTKKMKVLQRASTGLDSLQRDSLPHCLGVPGGALVLHVVLSVLGKGPHVADLASNGHNQLIVVAGISKRVALSSAQGTIRQHLAGLIALGAGVADNGSVTIGTSHSAVLLVESRTCSGRRQNCHHRLSLVRLTTRPHRSDS